MILDQNIIRRKWTREELISAFNLYCQLPFGKLHRSNPQIMQLALLLDRTPSAVAFKLVNFASLDPVITDSGCVGMSNVSALDREIWNEFNANWGGLVVESQVIIERSANQHQSQFPFEELDVENVSEVDESFEEGRTRSATVQIRLNQSFFRRAVLASYQGRCCMSGISHPGLLVASHIVPWSKDKMNRLNPRNGLCLSALHDKAFDSGLISLDDDFQILISDQLRYKPDEFTSRNLLSLQGKSATLPEKFLPDRAFLSNHRTMIFKGK